VAPYALFVLQTTSVLAARPDERLLHPVPPTACHASGEEIVVCAKSADAYRLPRHDAGPERIGMDKAERGLIGDAKIGVSAAQRTLGGASAPAAMVTITVPF
jgi:hypothetical protein